MTSSIHDVPSSPQHPEETKCTYHCPFFLDYDPMDRLILLNIDSDPDEIYEGFEPQAFNDPINGKGILVLAYRRYEGTVDIFKSPALSLGHKNFDIVGNGLCEIFDRPELDDAVFETNQDEGVHLDMTFLDKQGRVIELQVKEPKLPPPSWHSFLSRRPQKPFALLAPLGSGTKCPPSLPLIFLYNFYFVRKKGTIVRIVVDGRNHVPDDLPIRVDGFAVSFLRYSSDPFTLTMNDRKHNGELPPMEIPSKGGVVEEIKTETHAMSYEFTPDGDKKVGMKSMKVWTTKHALKLSFSPPFPDVKGVGETK
jgi:hypothetical protein